MKNTQNTLEQVEESTISDAHLRKAIWGPFYHIAHLTGLILPIDPQEIKTTKGFLRLIPNFLVIVILLVNTVYSSTMMSAMTFSVNWCYSVSLLFFAIHSTVCSIVMTGYKFNNYFSNVITLLRKATRNNFSVTSYTKGTIFKFTIRIIWFTVMMLSMLVYCVDNFIMYHITVTVAGRMNAPSTDIQYFRNSMFGNQSLFIVDTIIKIYGMLVSTSCLFMYVCANGASCAEFSQFNVELKNKIENKSILRLEVVKTLEFRLIDYLTLIKYVTENAVGTITIGFMSGVMILICSMYPLRAFKEYLFFGTTTFGFWIVAATLFLFYSTSRVGSFHQLLMETNDLLNLSHEIEKEASDDRVRQVVRDMIGRINTVDYGSKNMLSVKSGTCLFALLILIIPFSVDFLIRYKHVPEFLISMAKVNQ